jgi:hypothetical protein
VICCNIKVKLSSNRNRTTISVQNLEHFEILISRVAQGSSYPLLLLLLLLLHHRHLLLLLLPLLVLLYHIILK